MQLTELQKTVAIARADFALCRQSPLQCMVDIFNSFNSSPAASARMEGPVEELRETVILWQKLSIPSTEAMERIGRIKL